MRTIPAVVAGGYGYAAIQGLLDPSTNINFRYQVEFPERGVELNVENGDLDEVRNARRLRAGESNLDVYDGALEAYTALARTHGFLPVLSYAPSAYPAYADYVKFEDPELSELMLWFCDSQREHLRRKSEELGLLFVDLTPAFRAAVRELGADEILYRPISVHYATAGERTAAEAVAAAITGWERNGSQPD